MTTMVSERSWTLDAACASTGLPDMWASNCRQADIARHICLEHCPVLAECEAERARYAGTWDAYRDIVMAGVSYDQSGRPLVRQEVRRACWLCSGLLSKPVLEFRNTGPAEEHGTALAYRRHRLAAEPTCDACKAWRRQSEQQRKIEARKVGVSG